MQTFLPYKSFEKTAASLDSRRLNKQILESYQILNVLSNPSPTAGWRNHPAVKMWRGHEFKLFDYAMVMAVEADMRGIRTEKNLSNLWNLRNANAISWGMQFPSWYSNKTMMKRVTTTHKANLFKKEPESYPQFYKFVDHKDNSPCCDACNYFWVSHWERDHGNN